MIQLSENSKLYNALVEAPSRIVFFDDTVCSEIVFNPQIRFFHANVPMDVWMKTYLRYRNQPRFRVPRAVRDFFAGIKDRFPVCCILNYCWGTFWNIGPQGTKRGEKHMKNGTPYVPCLYHSSARTVN